MQIRSPLPRAVVLALSLLSACAAADPTPRAGGEDIKVTGAAAAFLTARFAAAQNDNELATQLFQRTLAADPGNPALRQQAFITALLAGRPEAARLAQMMPDDQVALLVLGNADAKAGRWEQAEARFANLPRQGLAQVLQPLLLAWAQAGEGRSDVALAGLAASPDAQRFHALFTLHGALIADLGRKAPEAARLYRAAVAEFGGTDLSIARQVASWQMRQAHPEDARQTIATLTQANPDLALLGPGLEAAAGERQIRNAADGIAELYLSIAGGLRQQERAAFSPILVQLALDLRPDSAQGRLLLADLQEQRHSIDLALRALAPVSAADPLAPLARLRQAGLMDRAGDTEGALKVLEQLSRDMPNRPEPSVAMGDLLRQKKRFNEAIVAYDRAAGLMPQPPVRGNWVLFYNRGIALDRAKQWARAEADFLQALDLAPEQPFVLNYLGYSWTEQGRNLTRAREMIERAVRLRPNDGEIADSLGWVLYRQGDAKGALKHLERAVEIEPNDATINGHLGDIYWAVGRKLEAQFQWRRALILNPDADDIPKLQAKLRDAGDNAGQ